MSEEMVSEAAAAPAAGYDWQNAAVAFLGDQDLTHDAKHDEDCESYTSEGHPDLFMDPEKRETESVEGHVGVFRTYELRRGINRQPLMEYYDFDPSGTYIRRHSPESDDDQARKRRRKAARSKSSRRLQRHKKAQTGRQGSESSGRDTEPEFELGEHVTVERPSGLNHPMTFFGPPRICDWCHDVAYGMIEPGRTTFARYKMIDEVTSLQWFPAWGSARSHRKAADHMCTGHAMARLKIALCPCHHLTRIESAIGEHAVSQTRQADRLRRALQRLKQRCIRRTDQFCDVCLQLATHHCDSKAMHQPELSGVQPLRQIPGCGLRLCDLCVAVMQARSSNNTASVCDVQGHVRWILTSKDNPLYPSGARPDAELLLRDGLLVRNYKQLIKQFPKA